MERYDAPAPARAALAIQVSNVAGDIVTTKGDAISGHWPTAATEQVKADCAHCTEDEPDERHLRR